MPQRTLSAEPGTEALETTSNSSSVLGASDSEHISIFPVSCVNVGIVEESSRIDPRICPECRARQIAGMDSYEQVEGEVE